MTMMKKKSSYHIINRHTSNTPTFLIKNNMHSINTWCFERAHLLDCQPDFIHSRLFCQTSVVFCGKVPRKKNCNTNVFVRALVKYFLKFPS